MHLLSDKELREEIVKMVEELKATIGTDNQ